MSLETREIKLFGWDIPGFSAKFPCNYLKKIDRRTSAGAQGEAFFAAFYVPRSQWIEKEEN